MKQLIVLLSIGLFIATGCGNKSADNTVTDTDTRQELLAGDVQKTWKAVRETDAQGDKERLDRQEKKERVVFYRTGKYTMTGPDGSEHGTWRLESNNLAMQPDGGSVSENFNLVMLDKNELHLRAGDGSELRMKPD
jgi:hypothetical protein